MSIKINYSILINTLNASAIQCIQTMELIKNNNVITSCLLPYQILASTSIELFSKLIILKRLIKKEKEISLITEDFKILGHNFEKIFSKENLGDKFLKASGINNVKTIIKDNEIYRYDFMLSNQKIIHTYDPESLKYWMLSKHKPNASVIGYQSNELLELCKTIESLAHNDEIY